jgi:WS/DGAT/MGAT family acyltransferase
MTGTSGISRNRPGPGRDAAPAARPLSDEDLRILALENEKVAGHTCKVMILRGPLDVDQLRESIGHRLALAPELSMRLRDVGGAPSWVADASVDLNAHVVAARHPVQAAPGARGESGGPGATPAADDEAFRATVAGIFGQRLDRSRPLWRIDVVPALEDGGSALVWRIHHALADGLTAMRIARTVLWDGQPGTGQPGTGQPGTARSVSRARPRRPPAARASNGDRNRLAGLLAVARELPEPWLRSPFSGHIDARRAVAFATADLRQLHAAAGATGGATVNDAVLTVVAGGLRRWLEAHHGQLGAVRVKVPVSMHGLPLVPGKGAAQPGNRDSFFCLDLPLGSADPVQRLAAISRATRLRKQEHDAQRLDALMRRLGRTPRLSEFAARVLAHPRSFALNVSNVPGPRQPVAVHGIPVQALYSLAEIREYHALRVAVVSLAGTLNFGLVADPTLLADVGYLAALMQAEATALAASAPQPGPLSAAAR